jgi:hypothetical protein
MSSTPKTKRQPKGRPVGGQYAEHARDAADVVLPIGDGVNEPASAGLSDREILEQSIRLAGIASRRAGLSKEDAEDIAQETVYSVLMTKSRNGNAPVGGGLIRVASRALVSRQVDTHKRHEDSRAFARWKSQVGARSQEFGRALTNKELDKIAMEIREDWENPRHRPSVGFQHETKVISLNSHDLHLSKALKEPVPTIAPGNQSAHYVADLIEDKKVNVADVRTRVWNLISDDIGVSPAIAGSITDQHKEQLKRVKNAVDVARAYEHGYSTPTVDALFLPFGELSSNQKHAIAKAIIDRPSVGHQLWSAARDFSSAA